MGHPHRKTFAVSESVVLGGDITRLEPVQTGQEPLTILAAEPLLPEKAITQQRFRLDANNIEYV
jgi:hypothetical protein